MRRWDTGERSAPEQYSYWREVVCEAFTPLRPTARGSRDSWNRDGLRGWVATSLFGDINGAEIGTCDQTMHHGVTEVGRTEQEVVFVNLMLSGRCVVRQGATTSLSGPGSFSVVDATRPFRLDYLDDWRTISFRVPHHRLADGLDEGATAFRFSADSGLSSVVADTMRSAWRAAPTLSSTEAERAGTALAALVGALVREAPREAPTEPLLGSAGDEALRHRIDHFVERQLLYGSVSPTAVARHFGISVRKLHLLYEDAPATFGQTVMRLRAEQCAQDLVANRGVTTLTDLAAKWGFSDLSHLNRVFVHHFGCRAAEYAR